MDHSVLNTEIAQKRISYLWSLGKNISSNTLVTIFKSKTFSELSQTSKLGLFTADGLKGLINELLDFKSEKENEITQTTCNKPTNRHFFNLILFQALLFRLYFRKFVKNLVTYF